MSTMSVSARGPPTPEAAVVSGDGQVIGAGVADALVTLLLAHVIVHDAHDPATMAAARALAVDQDNAGVEPGRRGNQRDTLAQ
jgi:hypothetical protein